MADYAYVAVTNIPSDYHAADLRDHFSALVESKSFLCFHYRHRPEKSSASGTVGSMSSTERLNVNCKKTKRCCVVKVAKAKLLNMLQYNETNWTGADGEISEVLCNVSAINPATQASITDDAYTVEEKTLAQMPELNPPPMMPNGNVGTPTLVFLDMIQQCLLPQTFVKKLQLKFPKTQSKNLYGNVDFDYCTPDHEEKLKSLNQKNLSRLTIDGDKILKANDPKHFDKKQSDLSAKHVQLVCTFPGENEAQPENIAESSSATVASEDLSLTIQQNHLKTDFPEDLTPTKPSHCDDKIDAKKCSDFKKPYQNAASLSTARERKRREKAERRETRRLMAEGIEERFIAIERRYHNDDDAEEWDRHEASEDDPSNQERNKERLYETEEETPWEKGGPGVVFYTDANFWQAREGDFDEQTTDDLDVDFSAYEEAGAGDKDIKDFLKIQQEERFRSGYDKTDRFSVGIAKRMKVSKHHKTASFSPLDSSEETRDKHPPMNSGQIGKFEQFSKGVGRKVMERHGWQDGQGLGRSRPGMKTALKAHGQGPHNKRGLGYLEPSSSPWEFQRSKRRSEIGLISTVYDNPSETDPRVPLLQRPEPTRLKHRGTFQEDFSTS